MQTVSHATASRATAYENIPLIRDTLIRTRSYAATARQTGFPEATIRLLLSPPAPRATFSPDPIPLPQPRRTQLSPREVIMLCCAEEGLIYADVMSDSRRRYLARPRQRFMWLMRHAKPNLSMPEIARRFNRLDHTTVLHAIRVTEERYAHDTDERALLDRLVAALEEVEGPIKRAASITAEIEALEARLTDLRAQQATIAAVAMRAAA